MSESAMELIPEEHRAWAARVIEHLSSRFDEVSVGWFEQRPFSLILFIDASEEGRAVRMVAKHHLPHEDIRALVEGADQAGVEHEILSRLHGHFQNVDGCHVPEALALIEEDSTVVTRMVEGVELCLANRAAHRFRRRGAFTRLGETYRNIGRFLRALHAGTTSVGEVERLLETLRKNINYKLKNTLLYRDTRCGDDFAKAVMKIFDDRCASLLENGPKVTTVGRHGDFGGWNILVNGSSVTVIDFLGFDNDLVGYDVLKILLSLWDLKHSFYYSPQRVATLEKSFLDGLGTLPRVPQEVFTLCELYYRVTGILWFLMGKDRRFDRKANANRLISGHVSVIEGGLERSSWAGEFERLMLRGESRNECRI